MPAGIEIEVVRGRTQPTIAAELLALWATACGLDGPAAHERLREVVAVARADGHVVGSSSVYASRLPMTGPRRYWVLRMCVHPAASPAVADELLATTFAALDAGATGDPSEPLGLCALLGEDERRRRPEATWRHPPFVYAGYLGDGRQIRLAYFDAHSVVYGRLDEGGHPLLKPGYRVCPAEQAGVRESEVVAVWTTVAGVPPEEARRRLRELLVLATAPDGSLAGIYSAYLAWHAQQQAPMWHFRLFAHPAHRGSGVGLAMGQLARDLVVERFRTGADPRGLGIVYVIQSDYLQVRYPQPVWRPVDFHLIGQTPVRGYPMYVHHFPGVLAPEPPAAPVART